jgi:isoquinoline 1-oxidoreductase beta subunit
MIPGKKLSRRYFIRNLSLISGGLVLGCELGSNKQELELLTDEGAFHPNLFVELKTDGELILTASRSEMGQGVRTSLTSVIADEMGADWDFVKVVQAPGDDAYGNQNTDGSRSIRTIFEPMRKMGAMARMMLIAAAAKQWEVATEACKAEKHHVVNLQTGERLFFGDLVEAAAQQLVPENPTFKNRKDFNYIGKELPSIDIDDFTSGQAIYGMDVKIPGMKYAAVARCPVTFGTVRSFDATDTEKFPGVSKVLEMQRVEKPFGNLGGIAVVADNTWSALKGKEALKIEWEFGDNGTYDTEAYMQTLKENVTKKGKLIQEKGDVERAFQQADKIREALYELPHLVHAPMEAPNATARFENGTCEIWAPVQAPQVTRKEVSELLEIDLENVTIHVTLLGGGFGRKSKPDFVLEAAWLAKETGAPVQVIWSREDDIRHSYYHAISAQYLKGGLTRDGSVNAWLHRTAYPSITSTFIPGVVHGAGFEFQQGMTNLPYEIENQRFENGEAPAHVRIGWLRSVYNIIHGFSVNVFADELAIEAGSDPYEFRMKMLGSDRVYPSDNEYKLDTAKMKNVLSKVAENSSWGTDLPQGHGRGIAIHYSFYSYVASVVEVSVLDDKLKVHKIFTVADCGTVVNQNTVRAQLEGAAVFGLSLALFGNITAREGRILQGNYHDYEMLRIHQTPEIQIEVVQSEDLPTGIGEPGVPVIAPALINAIFDATGKRFRSLPLKAHGLV